MVDEVLALSFQGVKIATEQGGSAAMMNNSKPQAEGPNHAAKVKFLGIVNTIHRPTLDELIRLEIEHHRDLVPPKGHTDDWADGFLAGLAHVRENLLGIAEIHSDLAAKN